MIKEKIILPKIGFGTFGNDKYDSQTIADSVLLAIKNGYRLFDCASVYGNEKQIGEVFKSATQAGYCTREDLIITSKVWNDKHDDGEVIASLKKSLTDLGLEYIDIYFLHWPFPNFHDIGCSVDSRSIDSRPFFADEFIKVWRQLEWLKDNGYVREIAMSNMTEAKFEQVLPQCRIMPYAHEMELHPSFNQSQLVKYCRDHGMEILGYCPLGSPNRPTRDTTADDVVDTSIPAIISIAETYSCHPATICINWAVQNGWTPIPFSSNERNIICNLNAQSSPPFTDAEMNAINASDVGCRLVKGHVFLWNGATDWRDLWDMDGKVEEWVQDGESWTIKK